MNKYIKAIASAVAVFAVVLPALIMSLTTAVSVAQAEYDYSYIGGFAECNLTVDRSNVTAGDSVTLRWSTSGFTEFKINGEAVNGSSGTLTVDDVQENTVFTLIATNDSGASCSDSVSIACFPYVDKECELELQKTVNKAVAIPGDELTYTIKIKNIGEADCTGGGVKILDVLDTNIIYKSHEISSNLNDGYYTYSAYTNNDHTLRFNGNTLTPGESGTITWVGEIKAPLQCGDFKVKNQAKATAKELNNFSTWAYSNTVKTEVNNDCYVPKECELELQKTVNKSTAVPGDELTYTIKIKNIGEADCTGSGVMILDELDKNLAFLWSKVTDNIVKGADEDDGEYYFDYDDQVYEYDSSDHTLEFNGGTLTPGESGAITWVGKVKTPRQCGDFEINNQAKATAQELNDFETWVYSNTVTTEIDYDCYVPKECELELQKTVNKVTSVPGDNLTYTIKIKNVGGKDCTGSGVMIVDEIDDNITFLSSSVTNNISKGSEGSFDGSGDILGWEFLLLGLGIDAQSTQSAQYEYDASNHALHFNGNTLTPGESGTITWVGEVKTPAQCGDFEVTNQAKATAKELNNFNTWAYSNTVKTQIDNDCDTPDLPVCTLTPVTQTVAYGETATLNWTTDFATSVSITDFGSVALDGSDTTSALFADKTYVLTASSDEGEVTCPATVYVGDEEDKFATVIAEKIICTDESQLPNYGTGGPNMTANTAADWVAGHDTCSLVSGWEFEWTDVQGNDPGDTLTGRAGSAWNTFGLTDSSGATSVVINLDNLTNDRVWFREVLQDGYIPFTHGQNAGTNVDDVTAEFYCNVDVLNYDNYDFILGMQTDATYHCVAWNSPVPEVPAPSCDAFTATPSSIMVGNSTTLTWATSDSVQVFLNNGIGAVDLDGSLVVSPLADIIYKLTVIGAEDKTVECEVPVTVSEDPVPVCEFFTAAPNSLPVGGGDVTLDWKVLGADDVSIAPTIGVVGLVDSLVTNVTESTTFVLTATDDNGDEVSCSAPVAVADPEPETLTCASNVSFNVSDDSIARGNDTTLTWSTTGVDTVTISTINATTLSGSQSVTPADDITYTLTATKGDESISCPLSVTVSSGGGGGGTATPRCELDISDTKIKSGDEIELVWDTKNATEVTLMDDRGIVIFTTDDFLFSEKKEYFDSSIKLNPTRDTEYTLLVERGSRDRECKVDVEVEDTTVVLQVRDQQPLVAGISLSQVPYTGFEAGPFMTMMFYMLLVAWAFYIAYVLAIRKRTVGMPTMLCQAGGNISNVELMEEAKNVRPDAFPVASSVTTSPAQAVPTNLPVAPVVNNPEEAPVAPQWADDTEVTELEDIAHAQKALLSSDAVRYFISTTAVKSERKEVLNKMIIDAKKNYPLEDGWMVINESRMQNLCEVCEEKKASSQVASFAPATVPEGSGSLAEAIVIGNVVAAYEMIGNRPMISLADAATDLDSVFRNRKGGSEVVSKLLTEESKNLSDEQIKNMIDALTGALDGTYTDEASAVKMAIMKAVKESVL